MYICTPIESIANYQLEIGFDLLNINIDKLINQYTNYSQVDKFFVLKGNTYRIKKNMCISKCSACVVFEISDGFYRLCLLVPCSVDIQRAKIANFILVPIKIIICSVQRILYYFILKSSTYNALYSYNFLSYDRRLLLQYSNDFCSRHTNNMDTYVYTLLCVCT